MNVVAFRCDGDRRIGAGHVARCLALARAFRDAGEEVVFVGRYADTALGLLEDAGFEHEAPRPDEPVGVAASAVALAVVDSYEIASEQVSEAAALGAVAAVADDGAAPPGALALDYHAGPGTAADGGALRGWAYAPIDARYVAARRGDRGFGRALVTVGGGDAGAELREAARAAATEQALEADVVGGESAAGPRGLFARVAAADVAVSAAGVTAYELACAGLPAALVAIADNQRRIAETFADHGLAVVEDSPRAGLRRLADADARAAIATAGPRAVDGYGAHRARDALLALVAGRPAPPVLRYRPAVEADSPVQLAWRNDPCAVAASWAAAPVAALEHERWFAALLVDNARTLLVAEADGVAVGSARFDVEGTTATISVVVAPERRGAGVGGQIVRESSELFLAAHPQLCSVVAEIRPDNGASLRVFERAGFAPGPLDRSDRRTLTRRPAHLASPAT